MEGLVNLMRVAGIDLSPTACHTSASAINPPKAPDNQCEKMTLSGKPSNQISAHWTLHG